MTQPHLASKQHNDVQCPATASEAASTPSLDLSPSSVAHPANPIVICNGRSRILHRPARSRPASFHHEEPGTSTAISLVLTVHVCTSLASLTTQHTSNSHLRAPTIRAAQHAGHATNSDRPDGARASPRRLGVLLATRLLLVYAFSTASRVRNWSRRDRQHWCSYKMQPAAVIGPSSPR